MFTVSQKDAVSWWDTYVNVIEMRWLHDRDREEEEKEEKFKKIGLRKWKMSNNLSVWVSLFLLGTKTHSNKTVITASVRVFYPQEEIVNTYITCYKLSLSEQMYAVS